MSILGMGPGEIFVILVVALIVFGPDKLPDVARQVGRFVREVRRMTSDLTAEYQAITQELTGEFSELRAVTEELSAELRAVQNEMAAVQTEVAQEVQSVQQTLSSDSVSGTAVDSYTSATTAAGTIAPVVGSTTVNGSGSEAAPTTPAKPAPASKADPRSDVSLLDIEAPVVMARTPRSLNGHGAVSGAEPVLVASSNGATRQPRSGRRSATTYQRPRVATPETVGH